MSELSYFVVHGIIERTLWHETQDGRVELPQADLLKQTKPLVVLGEAGMGKSHLLEWLATSPGYTRCTARQLINRYDPRTLLGDAHTLVIDALDEVSAQREGDATDLVLRQLGMFDYPRFVLSCRVADWRSATGLEAIREQYPEEPLQLHLEPFDDDDAAAFLSASLGTDSAKAVVEHFNARGLNGLLGNPQTLEFIARVAKSGNLPETRSELFGQAIEILRVEHRDTKAYVEPAREIGLDATGAAFAGIILTSSEAIRKWGQTPINTFAVERASSSRFPFDKFGRPREAKHMQAWMKRSVLLPFIALTMWTGTALSAELPGKTEAEERRSFMETVIKNRPAEIEAQLAELKNSDSHATIAPPPALTPFGDWDFYYLKTAPLIWRPNKDQNYKSVTVPIGFTCDLTSIPRAFWSIARPEGRYAYAAIVHDYLYWTQDRPRKEADEILRIAMQDSKVDKAKVMIIYKGVRELGQTAWDNNARLKAKGEKRVLKRFPTDFTTSWSEWKKTPDVFAD